MPIITNPLDPYGLRPDGSSGSVQAAVAADAALFSSDNSIVAVSPDLGDKYLDSVFSPEWAKASYGIATATFNDGASAVPCEPLSDMISRHDPAPVDASQRPRKSNGHDWHVAAGPDSRGR
jgi:hypothetical protein